MPPRRVGWRTGSCCTGHRDLPVVWSGLPRAVPLARSVPRGVNDRKLLLTCRLDSIRAPTVWRGSRSTCTFQLRHECTSCMTYFENSVGIEQNDRPRPGVSAIGFSESLNDLHRHDRQAGRRLGHPARRRRVVTLDTRGEGWRALSDGGRQRAGRRWRHRRDAVALAGRRRRVADGAVVAGRRAERRPRVRRPAERAGGGAPAGHRRAGLGDDGREHPGDGG